MDLLIGLLFPFVPLAALWAIVRYGPIIVTPGANQGPLLGIFITGPLGTVIGLVWGMLRTGRRGASGS